ncbi:MAG: hypothetical protein ACJ8F7_19430 [Gemmataceae bacterium]
MGVKKTAHKTFNIWLKNLAPGTQYYWGEGTMYMVGNHLVEYFNAACDLSPEFDKADFSWEPDANKIEDYELLVYVLQSSNASIVKSLTKDPLGPGGSTFPTTDKGVASEIYLGPSEGDADFARLIANLIFHEFLHNKLDAFAPPAHPVLQDVHTQGGAGLAVESLKNSDRPTPRNLQLMASNLGKKHSQYTGDLYRPDPYISK